MQLWHSNVCILRHIKVTFAPTNCDRVLLERQLSDSKGDIKGLRVMSQLWINNARLPNEHSVSVRVHLEHSTGFCNTAG